MPADNTQTDIQITEAPNSNGMALIIGASSAIAASIMQQLLADPHIIHIIAVSRQPSKLKLSHKVTWLTCDNSPISIKQLGEQLNRIAQESIVPFSRVCICNGLLHQENSEQPIKPEKRLEDIDANAMSAIFNANSIVPMLWLQQLLPALKSQHPCVVSIFSARVGSITDNQLGGWYSYRASKSALNMLIKTTAIEYARRAKNIKLIAFHPGTTDTPLSKPFQANVPNTKLFSTEYVATQLLSLMQEYAQQRLDGTASFIDWQGKSISW